MVSLAFIDCERGMIRLPHSDLVRLAPYDHSSLEEAVNTYLKVNPHMVLESYEDVVTETVMFRWYPKSDQESK